MERPILIVGASGRAAAGSLSRAGWTPWVIDLFGDRDTRLMAHTIVCPIADYPQAFIELSKRVPPMPWMYVGGLENYPNVIDTISRDRELIGNNSEAIRKVRDWPTFSAFFNEHRIPTPTIVTTLNDNSRWLCKPRRGSGGRGIEFFEQGRVSARSDEYYFQQYIDGTPGSVIVD